MTQPSFKRFSVVLALVLLVIAGSLYLAARSPSATAVPSTPNSVPTGTVTSAQPRVVWSQSGITIILLPGDIKQRNITFASNASLHSVSIEAVPEIAPFLRLTPSMISDLAPNEAQLIQLLAIVPASTTISSSYNGTIHVNAQTSTIPQSLKVLITVGVPPDPGTGGNATLVGIDSDGDGVRDDVQRYIGLTYPQSAKKRAALSQIALELETQLTRGSAGTQEVTYALVAASLL